MKGNDLKALLAQNSETIQTQLGDIEHTQCALVFFNAIKGTHCPYTKPEEEEEEEAFNWNDVRDVFDKSGRLTSKFVCSPSLYRDSFLTNFVLLFCVHSPIR